MRDFRAQSEPLTGLTDPWAAVPAGPIARARGVALWLEEPDDVAPFRGIASLGFLLAGGPSALPQVLGHARTLAGAAS